MLIVDIANEIWIDEGSPTNTSIPAIAFWIRGQVGRVNNLLCEDLQINESTLEITHCNGKLISLDIISIFKQLYRLYALQLQINNNMNFLASDSLISVVDRFAGGSFTRINKNEISKTLISFRKDEIEILNNLVGAYKISQSRVLAVNGDDDHRGYREEPFISLRNV